jgi:hypothetical protein
VSYPADRAARVLPDPGLVVVPIVAVHGAPVPWGKVVVEGVPVVPARHLLVGLGLVVAAVLVARLRLAGTGRCADRRRMPTGAPPGRRRPARAGHATGPGVSGGPRSER